MADRAKRASDKNPPDEADKKKSALFKGFSRLKQAERFSRLLKMGALTSEDIKYLKAGGLKKSNLAEKFIENVIGYFQLPLGVAANFCIDGKSRVIPMAVEETSIIASASKTARWINEHGFIKTSIKGAGVTGQIQIDKVKNFENLKKVVRENEKAWTKKVHEEVIPSMHKRGGGIIGFKLRCLPLSAKDAAPPPGAGGDEEASGKASGAGGGEEASGKAGGQEKMAILHVVVDTCDAMGANIVNQICEYLKTLIEPATGEKVSLCIVSNLSDSRLARAEIVMSGLDPLLMTKIERASLFAETDPYRAATGNKGVMNGIDAVLIATGNDWRAVSAGVHAYSARNGLYQSITRWRVKDGKLHGYFEAPLMVGTVGGMTSLHPTAQMSLKMLGVKTANDFARICSAVGLVQNLGALRALTTVGIIEGHMKLHIQNLTLGAGAKGWEIPVIQKHLEIIFGFKNRISLSQAVEALKALRKKAGDHALALKRIRDKHRRQAIIALKALNTHPTEVLKKQKQQALRALKELKAHPAKALKKFKAKPPRGL